jgi:PHIKZ077
MSDQNEVKLHDTIDIDKVGNPTEPTQRSNNENVDPMHDTIDIDKVGNLAEYAHRDDNTENVDSMTIEEMIQNGELSDKQPKKEAVIEESRIMDPSLFESLKAETPEIVKIDFEAPVEEKKPAEDKKKSAAKILHNVQSRVGAIDKSGVKHWVPSSSLNEEKKPASKPIATAIANRCLNGSEEVIDFKKREDLEKFNDSISIPPDSKENIIRYVTENPHSVEGDMGSTKLYQLTTGMELISGEEEFVNKTLNDENVEISTAYTREGSEKKVASHRSMMRLETGNVSGIRARAAIMDSLGLSTFFEVVLPHSGLVAVISAPLVHELVDLQTTIDTSKINLGRSIGGSNYGTTTWFIGNKLVDLFIKKIERINVKNYTPELLRTLIDPMDIPTIAWALACTKYPDGYTYSRLVLGKEGRTESVMGTINLNDISFPLNSKLSIRQKQHLGNADNIMHSVEEIESYRRDWKAKDEIEEFKRTISERSVIQNGHPVTKKVEITFTPTNVDNYVEHGTAWDVYLREAINETLAMVPDENVRSEYLARKITATSMREYSHLIKEITITNDYGEPGKEITTTITSHSDIMDFIDISANDINLIKKFREAVIEFINQQTKIVYGVPVANETEETHELSNSIVPINPVMLFFILTGRIYQSLGN